MSAKKLKKRITYKNIKHGTYTPEELGVELPGVVKIYVGRCFGKYRKWFGPVGFGNDEIAHAHATDICYKDPRYILKAEGEPDDILLHEYAHILTEDEHGHGPQWRATARALGIKPRRLIGYYYKDR